MKRTLITIALTAVVVLTLVGMVSSSLFRYGAAPLEAPAFGSGGGGGGAEYYAEPPMAAAPAFDAAAPLMDVSKSAEQVSNAQAVDVNRLVIKNADLAIVVRDPKADMARISKLAEDMGGYVVSSNMYQSYYGPNNTEVPEASVTIRVPADRLDEALAKIKETAVDVNYENVSGVDVTSEYVDLKSRLEAKQDAEKQLLKIMETAEKAEDVLAIYMQVQNIQTEIEVLKGQIKYYEESAALSSVSVRLIAEETAQPIEISPWLPGKTFNEAIERLGTFAQNFADLLIEVVAFALPALILIAIPVYGAFVGGRAIFRRLAKPKVKTEERAEEQK